MDCRVPGGTNVFGKWHELLVESPRDRHGQNACRSCTGGATPSDPLRMSPPPPPHLLTESQYFGFAVQASAFSPPPPPRTPS